MDSQLDYQAYPMEACLQENGEHSLLQFRKSGLICHQVGSLKTPPFSFAIGTIPGMVELAKVTPSATHPHGLMTMLQRKYNLDNLFLLDNYPVSGERQLVIADPVSIT